MDQKRTRSTSNSAMIKKSIRKFSRDSDYESDYSESETPVKKRMVKLWKAEEDQMLQQFYKEFNGNWIQIAQAIPDRNPSQCSQRWKRINPNRIKMRKQWSEEEDQQVVKLIGKYGKNWKRIENEMSGRSGKQIRERFINKLDQNINHNGFTESEDEAIYNSFQKIGPKWSEISKLLQGRPENMVKNRFYSHIRKIYKVEIVNQSDDQEIEQNNYKMGTIQSVREDMGTIQSMKDEVDNLYFAPQLGIKKDSSVVFGAYNRQNSSFKQQEQLFNVDSFGSQGPFIGKCNTYEQGHSIFQFAPEAFMNVQMPLMDQIFNFGQEQDLNEKVQNMSLEYD